MIKLIQGHERHLYPYAINEMHKLRKNIFHDRKGWDVSVIDQWEIDGYDALDPLYLLLFNEQGLLKGSMRLLPSMKVNMLHETFSPLLPEGVSFRHPQIYETSRFCINSNLDFHHEGAKISSITGELGLAMNEIGKSLNLTHMLAVYDAHMHRLLSRGNVAGEMISPPQKMGKALSFAVKFTLGDEFEANLRKASKIDYDILESASLLQAA